MTVGEVWTRLKKAVDEEWSPQCSLSGTLWKKAGCSGVLAWAGSDAAVKDVLAGIILQKDILKAEL